MRQVDGYCLWIGNSCDVRDPSQLFATGIGAVVDLAVNEPPAALPRELIYCRFPLVDGAGNPPSVLRLAAETVAALVRAEISTLVCCGAGLSRSPTVAAGALALIGGGSPRQSLVKICGTRAADVSPALWADALAAFDGGDVP